MFPDLPAELRLKIWREALPGPRILEVWIDYEPKEYSDQHGDPVSIELAYRDSSLTELRDNIDFDDSPKAGTVTVKTSQIPPTLLTVCRESRHEALKKYTLSLDTPLKSFHIPFDPLEDTIYVPFATPYQDMLPSQDALLCGTIFKQEVNRSIRHIATDIYNLEYLGQSMSWDSLDNIILIEHDYSIGCLTESLLPNQKLVLKALTEEEKAPFAGDLDEIYRQLILLKSLERSPFPIPQLDLANMYVDGHRCCGDSGRY